MQAIRQVVSRTLREAFYATITDLSEDIGRIVPKATGQLRDNLLANLKSSRVGDMMISITLGTSLSRDYAKFVNNMPTSSLRHSGQYRYVNYYGYSYKYGGLKRKGVHHKPGELQVVGTPVYLNDPDAQHNWMQFLVLHSRNWLKAYLRDFLKQNAAALGLKMGASTRTMPVEAVN